MEFFERLELEIEDIQEELLGVPLTLPIHKICDFGCGEGYTTLSLMLKLRASECIGFDKFSGDVLSPSLQTVKQNLNNLKESMLKAPNFNEGSLQQDLRRLISETGFPLFQKGDILKGNNFPDSLDFAYCKRVLGNIYTGEYDNFPGGEEGVSLAISNIANKIKLGGVFCAVEKISAYFAPIFEHIGMKLLRICRIQRSEIGSQGRFTSASMIEQYFVYCYRKN